LSYCLPGQVLRSKILEKRNSGKIKVGSGG